MMKVIILLFFVNLGVAQNIHATYCKTFLAIIGDDTSVPKELKTVLYSFEYSNGKSLYKLASSIKSSIKMIDVMAGGVNYQSQQTIIFPNEDTYYKDIKGNLFRNEYSDKENVFSIKDELEQFNWKLTGETAVVNGYQCKKATAAVTSKYLNRVFPTYAWFCEEIRINDGPAFFWGLPGLIIEVNMDDKYKISLTDLQVVKEDIVVDEPVNKAEMITRAELNKK